MTKLSRDEAIVLLARAGRELAACARGSLREVGIRNDALAAEVTELLVQIATR